jgi:hypothetical protein
VRSMERKKPSYLQQSIENENERRFGKMKQESIESERASGEGGEGDGPLEIDAAHRHSVVRSGDGRAERSGCCCGGGGTGVRGGGTTAGLASRVWDLLRWWVRGRRGWIKRRGSESNRTEERRPSRSHPRTATPAPAADWRGPRAVGPRGRQGVGWNTSTPATAYWMLCFLLRTAFANI